MKEQAQKAYEEYCKKFAESKGISIEEVQELKATQIYKEYIEKEWAGRADE